MNRNYVAWIMIALCLALVAAPSFGCAVCFGDTDSPMGRAVELSVLFMLIVTYVVIGGGLTAFIVLRTRARRRSLAKDVRVETALAGDAVRS